MKQAIKRLGFFIVVLLMVVPSSSFANRMEDIQGKQSQGELTIEGGLGMATGNFGFGFNGGGSAGIKFDKNFSLLSELEYHKYSGATTQAAGGGIIGISYTDTFTTFQLCLLAKYRFTQIQLRPYIFGGPGVVMSTASHDVIIVGQGTYPGGPASWNLMVEGGGGLEFKIDSKMSCFVQTKICANLVPDSLLVGLNSPQSSPVIYIPVQVGLDFHL